MKRNGTYCNLKYLLKKYRFRYLGKISSTRTFFNNDFIAQESTLSHILRQGSKSSTYICVFSEGREITNYSLQFVWICHQKKSTASVKKNPNKVTFFSRELGISRETSDSFKTIIDYRKSKVIEKTICHPYCDRRI